MKFHEQSWGFVIFRGVIGTQGQDAIFGAVYAQQGWHQKTLSVVVCTRFALDQPSINGSGPINRSEKMKRSETVGNSQETVGSMIGTKTCSTSHFF